jgi:putative endonuclease
MRSAKQNIGHSAEEFARNYLEQQGLKFVAANYVCKYGEIDLIMNDGDFYVFVEVRYRESEKFGDGVASITKSKQSKLISAVKCYLLECNLYDKVPCRFDVIALATIPEHKLEWIKDAFWVKW